MPNPVFFTQIFWCVYVFFVRHLKVFIICHRNVFCVLFIMSRLCSSYAAARNWNCTKCFHTRYTYQLLVENRICITSYNKMLYRFYFPQVIRCYTVFHKNLISIPAMKILYGFGFGQLSRVNIPANNVYLQRDATIMLSPQCQNVPPLLTLLCI